MTIDYFKFPIPSGFRYVSSGMCTSGMPVSIATIGILEHNQQLIDKTLMTRQLVNDYYPLTTSGTYPSIEAQFSGQCNIMWVGMEGRPRSNLQGKVLARKKTNSFSNCTALYFTSTARRPNPTLTLSGQLATLSGTNYQSRVYVSGEDFQWYEFNMEANVGNGTNTNFAMWSQSSNPTENSEVEIRFISLWETT